MTMDLRCDPLHPVDEMETEPHIFVVYEVHQRSEKCQRLLAGHDDGQSRIFESKGRHSPPEIPFFQRIQRQGVDELAGEITQIFHFLLLGRFGEQAIQSIESPAKFDPNQGDIRFFFRF